MGMKRAHAHHFAVKGEFKNRNKVVQAYAKYSRQVLKYYEIDLYTGGQNLHLAPNEGHSNRYIKKVAKTLWELKNSGASRKEVIDKIEESVEKLVEGNFIK